MAGARAGTMLPHSYNNALVLQHVFCYLRHLADFDKYSDTRLGKAVEVGAGKDSICLGNWESFDEAVDSGT